MSLPACRPECPTHGPMELRPSARQTPEQRWCGTWYDCPGRRCGTSALLESPELWQQNVEAARRCLPDDLAAKDEAHSELAQARTERAKERAWAVLSAAADRVATARRYLGDEAVDQAEASRGGPDR